MRRITAAAWRRVVFATIGPRRRVGQQLDVNAAHRGSRLEAGLSGVVCPVPIGQGHTTLRFVGETVERIDKCAKVRGLRRRRGGPYGPMVLGVDFAAVQRQAVLLLLGLVKSERLGR